MQQLKEDPNRENARIAARGMFLAAAELCRHKFNVTPTSRNMAGADLLIADDRCRNTWTIQVKTTDQTIKKRRGWLIGKNAERSAHETHAYVFVMINRDAPPDFYVVPSGRSQEPEGRAFDARVYVERCSAVSRQVERSRSDDIKMLPTFGRSIIEHPAAVHFRPGGSSAYPMLTYPKLKGVQIV